ncbi:DNA cytosine methyltransferase [Paraburkholderia silvatlantica]|uniref:DNA (cytosine-5-)-methyltransferase n=1 Tax=Paraburkholderia silvatlantica TaxID=321895 RepID=A0ABR6FNH7_9BURK|nr:DNA cytosine methyltransferase [Paraburkholderia silvatlantica]MBB2928350.1 DNA (cytosine-5)-methyltransferase 1 [Paraburkholderia silvatlantica]PVY34603.1 DNA (cytosine-5)-methyltransferase 1 [Paraburkholderia silvatlantica]PXW38818.1 DNA (cytosine-5)-methyltransferase 1 [Paraburkholderia silvatlantica]
MKRDTMSLPLDLGSELIIDNFAGGGGASTGLERAFGRPVDVAINHDPEALAMHSANHPHTKHYCESVFDVDPIAITGNQPVALVWLSPDCKHFSKAKGGKPVSKKIRGLAWIALRWAAKVKPRVIMLENVEEFQTWGPLTADGTPCPKNRGRTFRSFVNALRAQGYVVDWRELRACDYGAPTIRKRLFLVARRDHLPIVWPTPTHGDQKSAAVRTGKLLPWRTAADCIDWSLPCPSIFERSKPLKDATLRRVAKGIMKFVVNSADPFIVKFQENSTGQTLDEPLHTVMAGAPRFGLISPTLMHVTHHGADRTASVDMPIATITGAHRGEQALIAAHITKFRANSTGSSADQPLHTVTAGGDCARPAGAAHAMGIVSATLIQTGYGEREGQEPRVPGLEKPLGTAVAGGVKHAVVSAFLAKHYGGHESPGAALDKPTSTITTQDHHHLVTAQLVGCGGRAGQSRPRDAGEPLATVTSKADTSVVTSHLVKLRNNQFGQDVREPMPTLTAGGGHVGEVRALLEKYHGPDAFGIVTISGEQYVIVDIGMRMLQPHELKLAQGFPASYVINPVVNGKPLSKSSQVRMIGNSVCPDVATALIVANFAHEKQIAGTAA